MIETRRITTPPPDFPSLALDARKLAANHCSLFTDFGGFHVSG